MKRAFKFLGSGAVGTFTGFAWPAPGAWIEVEGPLDPCRNGIHVCRVHELAHWLHDELWELEVDGDELAGVDGLVVRRARLIRRVERWDAAGSVGFAMACLDHARATAAPDAIAEGEEAARAGYPAVAAYLAAVAVARAAADGERAYADERAWQSEWIGRELL